MLEAEVLKVVLREMSAFGSGWRYDWHDFDGRILRNQLDCLADWAERARTSAEPSDYTAGTDFDKEQHHVD